MGQAKDFSAPPHLSLSTISDIHHANLQDCRSETKWRLEYKQNKTKKKIKKFKKTLPTLPKKTGRRIEP